jgi:hypothetical protein
VVGTAVQFQIDTLVGQIGRNPHRLGVAVAKQAGRRRGPHMMVTYIPGSASRFARPGLSWRPMRGGNVLGGCATVLNELGPVLRPIKTLQQLLE